MLRKLLLTSALAIVTMGGAQAAVFGPGGVVDFQYYAYGGTYNGGGSPATINTPGSATFSRYFTVSVSGNQIIYTYDSDTTWSPSDTSLDSGGLFITNGSLISAISGIPAFTSVTLDASSQLGSSGFTAANITWNATGIAVDWQNLYFAEGNTVIIDVNAVPEASTWAMMLAGFAGLGYAASRSRRTSALAAA